MALENAIQNRVFQIIQAPEVKQVLGQSSQTLQLSIQVNVIGDSAIEKAAAANGVKAAVLYILRCLPEPRLDWLRMVAVAATLDDYQGKKTPTAQFLGIAPKTLYQGNWNDRIDQVNQGQVVIEPPDDG